MSLKTSQDPEGNPIGVAQVSTSEDAVASIVAPAYLDTNPKNGKQMCPVVNINMVANPNGIQIRPQYQDCWKNRKQNVTAYFAGVKKKLFLLAED